MSRGNIIKRLILGVKTVSMCVKSVLIVVKIPDGDISSAEIMMAVGINLVQPNLLEHIYMSAHLLTGTVTGAFLGPKISAGFVGPHKSTIFFLAINFNRACRLHTITPYIFAGRTYLHKMLTILTDSFHQIFSL